MRISSVHVAPRLFGPRAVIISGMPAGKSGAFARRRTAPAKYHRLFQLLLFRHAADAGSSRRWNRHRFLDAFAVVALVIPAVGKERALRRTSSLSAISRAPEDGMTLFLAAKPSAPLYFHPGATPRVNFQRDAHVSYCISFYRRRVRHGSAHLRGSADAPLSSNSQCSAGSRIS